MTTWAGLWSAEFIAIRRKLLAQQRKRKKKEKDAFPRLPFYALFKDERILVLFRRDVRRIVEFNRSLWSDETDDRKGEKKKKREN